MEKSDYDSSEGLYIHATEVKGEKPVDKWSGMKQKVYKGKRIIELSMLSILEPMSALDIKCH